jgi:hypothetical protein
MLTPEASLIDRVKTRRSGSNATRANRARVDGVPLLENEVQPERSVLQTASAFTQNAISRFILNMSSIAIYRF